MSEAERAWESAKKFFPPHNESMNVPLILSVKSSKICIEIRRDATLYARSITDLNAREEIRRKFISMYEES